MGKTLKLQGLNNYGDSHVPRCQRLNLDNLVTDDFIKYTKGRYSPKGVENILGYAKKYQHILRDMNPKPLLRVSSPTKLEIILRGLKALADYHGVREDLDSLLRKHNIKVRREESISLVTGKTIREMMDYWRKAYQEAPEAIQHTLKFMLVSGLRPSEALTVMELLRSDDLKDSYMVREDGHIMLQHTEYGKLFLRKVKKVYMSFIPQEALEWAIKGEIRYQKIRWYLKKTRGKVRLKYARKIWATYMSKSMTEGDINLLQGRVSKSIFLRNYYRPDLSEMGREVAEKERELISEVLGS